jgi:hypothetical protein
MKNRKTRKTIFRVFLSDAEVVNLWLFIAVTIFRMGKTALTHHRRNQEQAEQAFQIILLLKQGWNSLKAQIVYIRFKWCNVI